MKQEWILALFGGGLIGLATSIMLVLNGRICGISSIFFGAFRKSQKTDRMWRIWFLLGLVASGYFFSQYSNTHFENEITYSDGLVIIAGLLVGAGTIIGSGCTSGHGVCGISRRSKRSFIATCTFILFGVLTVYFAGGRQW